MSMAIIIPAHNEAALIGACLDAVIASGDVPGGVEIVVAANGCTDATVLEAEARRAGVEARGWALGVLNLPGLGKPGALNAADAQTQADVRVYLDADVTVSKDLIPQLWDILCKPGPRYASGKVKIRGKSAFSRLYARLWARVPFMAKGVPGCGLFAVNGEGRARWAEFPPIISDDTFVRLQFTPAERHLATAPYDWPIAEGFARLLRVRRRQDAGVAEIEAQYPQILENDDKLPLGKGGALRLALSDPLGFAAYGAVALGVRLMPAPKDWSRGR